MTALPDVSMTMEAGSLHALLGENGEGKSTLIKVVTGIYQPETGSVPMNGTPVRFTNASQSAAGRLGVVHLDLNLVTRLSVGEAIPLDQLDKHLC